MTKVPVTKVPVTKVPVTSFFSIAGYCIQHRCDIFDFKELIVNFIKMHEAFDSFAFDNYIVRCLPIIYIVIQLR